MWVCYLSSIHEFSQSILFLLCSSVKEHLEMENEKFPLEAETLETKKMLTVLVLQFLSFSKKDVQNSSIIIKLLPNWR